MHLFYLRAPDSEVNITGSTGVLSIDSCVFTDSVDVSDEQLTETFRWFDDKLSQISV